MKMQFPVLSSQFSVSRVRFAGWSRERSRQRVASRSSLTGRSVPCDLFSMRTDNRELRTNSRGFTLIELIVATGILIILTGLAIPLVRVTIQRERERELREDLWQIRDAIDRYKDAADRGAFQIKVGSEGYPPDLDTLVQGVDTNGKKLKFLRRIPIDPMTKTAEWGMRSVQDDPASDSWGGQNVFDIYTKSDAEALDGTKYKDW